MPVHVPQRRFLGLVACALLALVSGKTVQQAITEKLGGSSTSSSLCAPRSSRLRSSRRAERASQSWSVGARIRAALADCALPTCPLARCAQGLEESISLGRNSGRDRQLSLPPHNVSAHAVGTREAAQGRARTFALASQARGSHAQWLPSSLQLATCRLRPCVSRAQPMCPAASRRVWVKTVRIAPNRQAGGQAGRQQAAGRRAAGRQAGQHSRSACQPSPAS
jgi:hypothetical protein